MVFILISFLPPVISPPARKEIILFLNNYNLSGGEFYSGIFGDFITGRDISEEERIYLECAALLDILKCNPVDQFRILAFCKKHDLFDGFKLVYSLIREIFKDLEDIKVKYTEDPEIEDNEKICFNVFLPNNDINAILDQEGKYNKWFEKHIEKEKSEFFILTCTINE